MSNTKIQSLVDAFVASLEIESQSAALAAVTAALGEKTAVPKAAAPKKRGRPKKSATVVVKKAPPAPKGKTIADLAPKAKKTAKPEKKSKAAKAKVKRKVLGLSKSQWKAAMRHALGSKQLSMKGSRRETTLHLG